MKKIYRLQKKWDFQKIIDSKNYLANKHLILYFKKSQEFKIGITVPKKFENAVGRNRNKRQLKAILHEYGVYDLKYHFVLIVRKDFCESDFLTKKINTHSLFNKFRNYEKK
ncbi:ribonuclease P protein component [Mycoplasma leonicaptivi]|uniref:ribonuclease P protein component n=1 Tax=Mycoplasma leonicaptivi TaxID=36742 RepID=UPI000481382C|nr:ribonuclease P protein component [Mycoplasma leonicaptivi]